MTHSPSERFSVREAIWATDRDLLFQVRHAVFIVEQSIPAELELDPNDADHCHVIALDCMGTPIGTGRVSPAGKIGRMAVLKPWRSQGVGSAILEQLIQSARAASCPTVTLSAQLRALPFYRRHGFIECGDVYQEAGIEHRRMKLELSPEA